MQISLLGACVDRAAFRVPWFAAPNVDADRTNLLQKAAYDGVGEAAVVDRGPNGGGERGECGGRLKGRELRFAQAMREGIMATLLAGWLVESVGVMEGSRLGARWTRLRPAALAV